MLTIEKSVKQMAPSPAITRAGTKNFSLYAASSNRKTARNRQISAVSTGINGMREASGKSLFHTLTSRMTLLDML